MVHLGQLKRVWRVHSQIVVNEKFRDGTARNNAFKGTIWAPINV